MNRRRRIRFTLRTRRLESAVAALVFLAMTLGAFGGQQARAQKSQPGKDVAEGLLRALIESQLERQGRESFSPGRPVPPVDGAISRPAQPTAEMQRIRQILTSLVQESAALSASAIETSKRNPDLRRMIPDILNFQAGVTAAQRRADRENNHLVIQLPVQSLDQSWKPLAHGLSTIPGIRNPTSEIVQRINVLNGQLCQTLGIGEQFSGRELVRAADVLAADIEALADEVSYTSSAANSKVQLITRIRRLQNQSALFANLAAGNARFATITTEYRNLYQSWQTLHSELNVSSNRSVMRTVARIHQSHRAIHQLLRLAFALDQALVQKMTEGLERNIGELFRTITLDDILTLPDSRTLAARADTLSGTAENLSDVVRRREPRQAVGEAWVYLDEQWQLFSFFLQTVRTPEARRRIEGIGQAIECLQDTIGIHVSFDRRAILQQTTAVVTLVEHLQGTVQRWLRRPGQGNVTLANDVKRFWENCRELEALSMAGRNQSTLSPKCDEVIQQWQAIRPKLSECQTDEREAIEQTIDSFIPALIRLRSMLEN